MALRQRFCFAYDFRSHADFSTRLLRHVYQTRLRDSSTELTEGAPTPTDQHTVVDVRSTGADCPVTSLETLDDAKVQDYIQTFQDVFGVLHPVSCLGDIEAQSSRILEATKCTLRSQSEMRGTCGLNEMFRMILAIAEVCNEGASTQLSRMLYLSVEPMLGGAAFARTITQKFRMVLLLVVRYDR